MALTTQQRAAAEAFNAGVAALRRGRPDEAVELLSSALGDAEPALEVEVRHALAVAHRRVGDAPRAAAEYARVARARPNSADAWLNSGAAWADAGELERAAESLARAASLAPETPHPRRALARVLNDLGWAAEAQTVSEAGLQLGGDDPVLLLNLARALKLQGRPAGCVDVLRRALRLRPADTDLLLNLAAALADDGLMDAGLEALREAAALRPDEGAPRLLLCMAHLPALYRDEAEVDERRAAYAAALRSLRGWAEAHPDALAAAAGAGQPFYLPYQGRNDRELQRLYGEIIHRAVSVAWPPLPSPSPPRAGERIRVGVVSGYIRAHANWRVPVEGWVRDLDRSRFSLFGYHTGGEVDATTGEAAGLFDRFVQGPLSTSRWRDEIAADAPHVLVYPELGMDPAALRLAAQRLAPTQCVSWGHPVTSGLPTMDVFLSSDAMEPADGQEAYTERLVRLPGLSTSLRARRSAPPLRLSREALGLPRDAPVCWCGQSPFKYLPQQWDVLARIAAEVPEAVFVFTAFPGSDRLTDLFAGRVRAAFERRPPARDRQVHVVPRMGADAFAAAMATADVVLDSLGWSGCNTLLESLEAGLPLVTTPGRFMRGRHGAALLGAMGLDHRVCPDEADYVAEAVRLARDPARRAAFATEVRSRVHCLFGDPGGVRGLERFLEDAVGAGGAIVPAPGLC